MAEPTAVLPETAPAMAMERPPQHPLKIALLTHSVNPRGGVVHTLELAKALQAAGHEVAVMAPAAPGQRMFRPVVGELHLVPVAGTPRPLREMVQSRIDAYLDYLGDLPGLDRFDIWHAHDGIGGNALATLTERGLIPGYVRTVHHLDRFDDALVMSWQARSVRAAERVLCVSRLWHEILAQEHGIEAAEVPNGVDLERFRPAAAPADDAVLRGFGLRPPRDRSAPVILALGGVEPRKNTLRLLQAFLALRQERPGAELLIAGGASLLDHDEYGRAFAAALQAAGLQPGAGRAVHLLGSVADDHLPALYRRADVLAMPSLREGFGLVVLEALACGTPVVASEIPPFTEYLDERIAEFADPLDSRSIADALRRALSRPRLHGPAAARSPAAGRAAALTRALCERYSWPASAERHLGIYRDVLAARAPVLTRPMTQPMTQPTTEIDDA